MATISRVRVGDVFHAQVPYEGATASVFVRVLRLSLLGTAQVHVVPAEQPAHTRTDWVTLDDLHFSLTAGVMTEVRTIECAVCGARMRLWRGLVNGKSAILFACRECEAVIEL